MERVDHINFIKDPDQWPMWPLLPVKKSIAEIGVVTEEKKEGYTTRFFFYPDQNIFSFSSSGSFRPIEDVEAFIGEGWRVD